MKRSLLYPFPAGDGEEFTKEESTTFNAHKLPLSLRKLAIRNAHVFDVEDRLKFGYTPQKPHFTTLQRVRRIVYRLISLDGYIPEQISYLFTLGTSVAITGFATVLYAIQEIEANKLSKMDVTGKIVSWSYSFLIVIGFVFGLMFLKFLGHLYHRWIVSNEQLLKRLRHTVAYHFYKQHNPYADSLENEFNSGDEKADPDRNLMWQMQDDEKYANKPRCVRCRRGWRRFCLNFDDDDDDNDDKNS